MIEGPPSIAAPPSHERHGSAIEADDTVTGWSVGRCSHHSEFDEVSSTPTRWPAGSFQSSP